MMLSRLALVATLPLFSSVSIAAPTAAAQPLDASGFIAQASGSTQYWLSNIQRQGTVAFGDASYKIFRNVKTDCGAAGDGSTDDTAALNQCIASGNRCGPNCDSSTVTPAILYFPPGTYVVSQPLNMYYYTQMIGDALQPPTIKAAANFQGMAVLDSDPYDYNNGGKNWFTNQNNFFREVRNFVIDLTAMPASQGAGIHWQVAQATSLQNIRFEMVQGTNSNQIGIFMDNGSGGFMADLTFNGGNYGMFLGNQQFTTRNLTFNNCNTAMFMNWNWLWTFKSVNVNNCKVGLDMANNPPNQTVGSVILQDSVFKTTVAAVNSSFSQSSIPTGGGTLVLDNVDFTGSPVAVQHFDGTPILQGGSVVKAWTQGQQYVGSNGTRVQAVLESPPAKPDALLANGMIFERIKPQYEQYPASAFVSVKSAGAKGDGATDDTAAIQNAMNNIQDGQILYFDHGAYIVTKTINVPKNIKITGEIWPLIMASGDFFANQDQPQPVFKIGDIGDVGSVELSELMFETAGPAPGAIMIQWNSGASAQGSNGMWDVHARIGGSAGTQLQWDKCAKNPNVTHGANPECIGANTLLHLTQTSSVYIENCWFWVADHELDLPAKPAQIDIYNGRGVLIESQGPVWMYGTASEHSVLYNYQVQNASNIYMGLIQTESPYFQSNPAAPAPFNLVANVDPPFNTYTSDQDKKAWGLRVVDSSNILVYGAGLYSFFDNYDQVCVASNNCQNRIVSIEGNVDNLNLFGLSTKASVSMVSSVGGYVLSGSANNGNAMTVDSVTVNDADNRSNFCATLALWRPG
ncbi:uncharacterized protein PV09_03968 [Verruconis gallopava]|uniref:Rhamnogalacturonase A/B/Epimerase-like pectate lyase domain-containing protein n=1 Tax=Verruconis gallopava TaxID=253628 RepID=A0A0D2B078_9PEZI|nr:uncharacterized protein PV09_03968 [Verruconis gallopava]KIW04779.1 hypothetical protein PV09_03968 [Verruconis gallopava]